jgi:hypothetical protein
VAPTPVNLLTPSASPTTNCPLSEESQELSSYTDTLETPFSTGFIRGPPGHTPYVFSRNVTPHISVNLIVQTRDPRYVLDLRAEFDRLLDEMKEIHELMANVIRRLETERGNGDFD